MVKYCIIVLTAGRKTARPVVPARRVARIRAACTLLSRPRPATCRELSRRRVASRSIASPFPLSPLSSRSSSKRASKLALVHFLVHSLATPLTTLRSARRYHGKLLSRHPLFILSKGVSRSASRISRHVPRALPLPSSLHSPPSRIAAASTPVPSRMTTEPRHDPVVFRVLSRVRCLAGEPSLGESCSSSSSSSSRHR